MKKYIKYLCAVLLAIGTCVPLWGGLTTFNPSTSYGSTSATQNGITITVSGGSMNGSDYFQVNSSKTLTISCNSSLDQITNIEITCEGSGNNSDGPGKLSYSGSQGSYSISGTKGTWKRSTSLAWTTKSTSITLNASARVRFTKVVVTYLNKQCSYMYYDGSTYKVWTTQSIDAVVPEPPAISGYTSAVVGDGRGGVAWCTKPVPTSPCMSYINNSSGDYKGCWRFVDNSGGADPDADNYPSGVDVLYPVYQDDNTSCYATGVRYVECDSPFGTLSATGGTTVTWAGSNVTKTISLSGKKGSGAVTWSVTSGGSSVPSSVATISGNSSSATLTIKNTNSQLSKVFTVTCHIAENGDYCEESKTIDITANAQTYTVTYHLTGVTKTSGPTTVSRVEDDLSVSFTINDGYTSDGIVGKVCFDDGGEWCYQTDIAGHTNIEFGSSNRLDYVNDGVFDRNIDVYIIAQEDVCTDPWMGFTTGTNRTVAFGSAGWTDAASVKVTAGGASTTQTITYSSTNESVATVNSSGVVTLGSVSGSTTISATAATKTVGDVKYCEKTVSYTVTVNCATPTTSANESGKELTVTSVTPTSARLEKGIIVSLGGESSNIAHGYVYGTNHNPTLSDNEKGWSGTNAVPYRNEGKVWGGWNITGLTPGTTYYVRTYVTTSCSTGYSPTEVTFTTPNRYYITYDANGGTGSISDQTKIEDVNVTLSDGSGFSNSGFEIKRWNTQADGGGTNYALGATYSGNADLDLFAVWGPIEYEVTLDKQEGTGGPASVTVTYNANTNLTSAVTTPTRTGYEFGGYFTGTNGGGTQLIGTDGNWIASAGGGNTYLDASKNWKYADDLVIYAKWTAIEISLVLSADGGEDDGSAIVLYDASGLKPGSLDHADYAGHTLQGYYMEETHINKVLNSDGSFANSNVTGMITEGKWSGTTTPVTLHAFWATNPQTVTFDLDGKGSNFTQVVDYNTTVSRPIPDPSHVDYNFVNWVTTSGGSTPFNFSTPITEDIIIYSKWTEKEYEHLIFSCVDADLVTEDGSPVLVTSRSGVNIMATKRLKLTVSGAITGHKINLTGDGLKFYKNDGIRFIELTGANALSAPVTDEIVYVSYNPSSTGTGAIATPSITVSCDGFDAPFAGLIKARNLPDAVTIVARVGNTWHALPANMATESTPAPIMVTTAIDGVLKAYGPSTISYKLWSVASLNSNTNNDRWGTSTASTPGALFADRLRFAGNSNNGLWANNSKSANGIKNYAAIAAVGDYADNEPAYEWIVTTTEVGGEFVYTLQTQQTLNSNNLRLWGNKWGTYDESNGQSEVYILPLTVVEPADISIMEWGVDQIAVKYANKASCTAMTAKVGESAAAAVTITSMGGDIYKLTGTSLTDYQTHPAQTLSLNVTEGSAKQVVFAIPLIVTTSKTEAELRTAAGGDAIAKGLDVVIRNGGTLTTGTAQGKFADLYIYPGGKADISRNIGVSNIYLRGGFSWLETEAEKDYRVPQMKVADGVTITGIKSKGNGIYYDLHLDKRRYYMMAVPRNVELESITNEEGGEEFTAWLKEYDGSQRTMTPKGKGWVNIKTESLLRGIGYEMSIKPRVSGRLIGVLRMPLLKETEWTDESNCTPMVTAHGYNKENVTDNNKGWNFIGNPFFTGFQNTDENGQFGTNMEIRDLKKHFDENDNWTGTYDFSSKASDVKYVTIPEKMYDDYKDKRAKDYQIDAFYPFFIQAKSTGALTFENCSTILKASMPAMLRAQEVVRAEYDVDFYITDAYGQSDLTGLTVGDEYSPEFDMEDKEKTIVNTNYMKVYTMVGEYRTAFNSLPEDAVQLPIPVGYIAPQSGSYYFSLKDGHGSNMEHVWLTDTETHRTVDLLDGEYEFSTQEGQFDNRLILNFVLKQEQEIPTNTENIRTEGEEMPIKFIYQNKIYILYHGIVYDITGKRVKEINK